MSATTDIGGSTAQGAVTGAAIGGGWGAVIGGVVGLVKGVVGHSHKSKARRKLREAAYIQKQREEEAYRQNLLSTIRQARIQRASNLAAAVAAGSEEGSGAQGALSSIGSQFSNVLEYMSVDRGRAVKITNLVEGAQKNLQQAQENEFWADPLGLVNSGNASSALQQLGQQAGAQGWFQPGGKQQLATTSTTYNAATGMTTTLKTPGTTGKVAPVPKANPVYVK